MLLQNLRRLVRPDCYEAQINLSQRRTWFADEPPAQPAADKITPEQPAADKPATADANASKAATPTPDWVKANPDKAYEELQKVRNEAASNRVEATELKKRLDAIEADQRKQADEKKKANEKELADQNRFKELADQREKELNDMRAQVEAAKLDSLRTRVGMEFKLPVSIISRLKGSTEDELKADAAVLVKDLGLDKQAEPTPQQKKGGTQTTAVAPGGPPAGETDAERRARLYKQGAQATPLFTKQDK